MKAKLSRRELLDVELLVSQAHQAENTVQPFKEAYQEGRNLLHEFHLSGGTASSVVENNTWLVDQLLHVTWDIISSQHNIGNGVALLAVGGYGRSELHPYSDIDLLILFERSASPAETAFAEHLVRFMWDIGLEVGHSVRTIKECFIEAKKDLTVITNLLEARHLSGDESLQEKLTKRISATNLWPVKRFFEHKRNEQLDRYARFEDTSHNLEPNIKEGPGGLRDIHTIVWVTRRYFETGSLHDLVEQGFLREDEYRALIRGRNFLWRLRNSLHFLARRREDRLIFDYQREIAREFGYQDMPGDLAVEQLMKRYYRAAKELHLLNEILLQHFQEVILKRGHKKPIPINRRFRKVDGFLEVVSDKIFDQHPYALIELFVVLQQDPDIIGVRAQTIRLIRSNLSQINAEFRKDLRCRSLFAEIFRQSTGLTHTLRKMNSYGVLGAYLPEFGRVVGQMQHDLFHVYTVDAHLLFVVRNLRRFAVTKHHHEFPLASDIITNLHKPFRLYLAGLLHDIAKGRGGDHSILGEKDAFKICSRHDLSDYDSHFVAWLVRNHLLMSWTAQKQDIDDPAVVAKFASEVGDQEHLDNLYLLTIADIRATSPHVWNSWKGQLLQNLYLATRHALKLDFSEQINLGEKVTEIQNTVLNSLPRAVRNRPAASEFWHLFEQDYFIRTKPDTIRWHTDTILNRQASDIPLVEIRFQNNLDVLQFLVFAPYSSNLFANVAGAFESLGLNIADARLHRLKSGMILLVFLVLTTQNTDVRGSTLSILSKDLRTNILQPHARSKARKRLPRKLKHFDIDTVIAISSHPSGKYSTMELITRDRPGLLHVVANGLLMCKVELVSARVSTFGEKVEDIFMITDRDGQPIEDSSQINAIKAKIENLLSVETK